MTLLKIRLIFDGDFLISDCGNIFILVLLIVFTNAAVALLRKGTLSYRKRYMPRKPVSYRKKSVVPHHAYTHF